MTILLNNKELIYFGLAIILVFVIYFLAKKYKLSKYQLLIVVLLTLFWTSICIIRSYRKIYMISPIDSGGLGLDESLAVSVVAAYGLISIFVRLPIFYFSDFFKTRKFFVLLALLFISVSSVVVYFYPNYNSLLYSSIALGVSASLISLFNVMFSDTFSQTKVIASVSILSISPLLAEFIVAPIQYYFTHGALKLYNSLWLVSSILAIIALIVTLFLKDNKEVTNKWDLKSLKTIVFDYRFLFVCLIGVATSFTRFATSGASIIPLFRTPEINMGPLLIAYADTIFSIFQIIAGLAMGLYLKNKIGTTKTLILGIMSSLIFSISAIFIDNPVMLFFIYGFNGFGYGITYNILIGIVLGFFNRARKEMAMGVYQTFFAIGIYYGDKIYGIIISNFSNLPTKIEMYRIVLLIVVVISIATIAISPLALHKKQI